ncbi:unnamed protein product, partial [Porites evermanni]
PALTSEKLEEFLEGRLRLISDLTEQLKQVLESISSLNTKYDTILVTLSQLGKDKTALVEENASLKTQQAKKSLNDLDQYTRRDCTEIRGIPLPEEPSEEDTNDIVIQLSEKIGVPMERNDISTSHRIPSAKHLMEPAIIVKFVGHKVRENFYLARKRLKSVSTADLRFSEANKIYINKSLTQKNKELFNDCLKFKKDHSYKFLWTNAGTIFLRRDADFP